MTLDRYTENTLRSVAGHGVDGGAEPEGSTNREQALAALSDEGLIELEWSWGTRWAKITAKGRSTLRRG